MSSPNPRITFEGDARPMICLIGPGMASAIRAAASLTRPIAPEMPLATPCTMFAPMPDICPTTFRNACLMPFTTDLAAAAARPTAPLIAPTTADIADDAIPPSDPRTLDTTDRTALNPDDTTP